MSERREIESVLGSSPMTGGAVAAKEHVLTVQVPDGPMWVQADPTRLKQVFCNLIQNAVSHSSKTVELPRRPTVGCDRPWPCASG